MVALFCCAAPPNDAEQRELKRRNEEIEHQLKVERARQRSEIKLLLLGAGESGKSTLFRQMKLIHCGKFSTAELETYSEIILNNTVQSMCTILDAMRKLNIPFQQPTSQANAEMLWDVPTPLETPDLPTDVTRAIEELWEDGGVRDCYQRSNEFQLHDSAPYFFAAIRRLAVPNYLPTEEDVLRCRVKTTGISEMTYTVGDRTFKMVDVGGQRSERKKWIHCFENVTAIIFMVAANEYDMTLVEDGAVVRTPMIAAQAGWTWMGGLNRIVRATRELSTRQNRMQEALYLFDSICNNKYFSRTAVILLMNKIDLLKEKILVSPLENNFPEYNGGPNYERAIAFLTSKFVQLHKSETREIYTHQTCATDTNQVKMVMADVNRIIVNSSLRNIGWL